MAQVLRPDSDVAVGGWTPTPAAPATLYDKVDEAVASDADYISSPSAPANAEVELGLTNGVDPGIHTGHILRYRIRKDQAGGSRIDATAKAKQGAAVLESWSHADKDENWTTFERTMQEANAANISDYTDLRFALLGNQV